MYTEVFNTSGMVDNDVKANYNAYQREYYKNKVDKTKRAEQFSAYYIKNKEAITAKRKERQLTKKATSKIHDDVTIEEVVSL